MIGFVEKFEELFKFEPVAREDKDDDPLPREEDEDEPVVREEDEEPVCKLQAVILFDEPKPLLLLLLFPISIVPVVC